MALFSNLIKCADCSKNYIAKKDRKHTIYECSGYHNKNSSCTKRFALKEEELIKDVAKHLAIVGKHIEDGHTLNEYVKVIEVSGRKGEIVIRYMHDSKVSIFNANRALF